MRALFSNAALWLPLSVAFGVQLYKLLADWVQTGRLSWRILAQAGGMPSSHSAMVSSLVTAIGYQNGLDSPLFAIAVVLAVIVMYDARGVRQESGKQARVLNELLRTVFSGHPPMLNSRRQRWHPLCRRRHPRVYEAHKEDLAALYPLSLEFAAWARTG